MLNLKREDFASSRNKKRLLLIQLDFVTIGQKIYSDGGKVDLNDEELFLALDSLDIRLSKSKKDNYASS